MSHKLRRYLNQKASWRHDTGEKDAYGKPIRAEALDIACRMETRNRLTKDRYGNEVVSDTTYFIEVPEGITEPEDMMQDTLDGKNILSIADMIDRNGRCIGYEVLL